MIEYARYNNLRRDLHRTYGGQIDAETIDEMLDRNIERAEANATVKDFLPVTVGRATSEDLADLLADTSGEELKERPEVLFVSAHNAGRSQLASALAHHLAGEEIHVRTVGIDGGTAPDPAIVDELTRRGIELDGLYREGINPRTVHLSDVIVLIGVDETPNVPGKRYEHWPIDDPVGATPEKVARITDEIENRVRGLISELGIRSHQPA